MRDNSSATAGAPVTGIVLGALGVLAFSLSLPATRVAVGELDPWLVAFGRATGAVTLATAYLLLSKAKLPTAGQWRRLIVVAVGVVVGFPLLTSLALTQQTSAHGAVVVTLLPMCTAVFAVLRAGERPPLPFWVAGGVGLAAVLAFVLTTGAVSGAVELTDLYLLGAVVLCGLGYAEGGALARDIGGARTICWALIVALPVTVPITVLAVVAHPPRATSAAWIGFGYLTVVSMFLGFFAWYGGLARGGIARIGQLQLAQPLLTMLWAAILLHEQVPASAIGAAAVVLACIAVTQRARLKSPQPLIATASR